jgi:hypothetical protein
MPRSQTPLHSPLLVALVAVLGVGACQTQSRSNGIETGSVGDRSRSDTGVVSDTGKTSDSAKPAEPGKLRVTMVMIGKGLGPDKRISEPTLRFAPTDTVFVSIGTEGTPQSSTLMAKWRFPTGKVRDSSSATIQPKGPQYTELHAAPPKGGWPVGPFQVTVYVDGDSVDAKTFAVDRPSGARTAAGGDTAVKAGDSTSTQ